MCKFLHAYATYISTNVQAPAYPCLCLLGADYLMGSTSVEYMPNLHALLGSQGIELRNFCVSMVRTGRLCQWLHGGVAPVIVWGSCPCHTSMHSNLMPAKIMPMAQASHAFTPPCTPCTSHTPHVAHAPPMPHALPLPAGLVLSQPHEPAHWPLNTQQQYHLKRRPIWYVRAHCSWGGLRVFVWVGVGWGILGSSCRALQVQNYLRVCQHPNGVRGSLQLVWALRVARRVYLGWAGSNV